MSTKYWALYSVFTFVKFFSLIPLLSKVERFINYNNYCTPTIKSYNVPSPLPNSLNMERWISSLLFLFFLLPQYLFYQPCPTKKELSEELEEDELQMVSCVLFIRRNIKPSLIPGSSPLSVVMASCFINPTSGWVAPQVEPAPWESQLHH